MQSLPSIPEVLLKALEERFPDRAPDLKTPDKEVWFKAGQAHLVRFLRAQFEEQTRTVIRKNP